MFARVKHSSLLQPQKIYKILFQEENFMTHCVALPTSLSYNNKLGLSPSVGQSYKTFINDEGAK
jgi:hypothetical protein